MNNPYPEEIAKRVPTKIRCSDLFAAVQPKRGSDPYRSHSASSDRWWNEDRLLAGSPGVPNSGQNYPQCAADPRSGPSADSRAGRSNRLAFVSDALVPARTNFEEFPSLWSSANSLAGKKESTR